MMVEVQNWPYSFPASEDFPKSEQRGNVNGRILVQDRYACKIKYTSFITWLTEVHRAQVGDNI